MPQLGIYGAVSAAHCHYIYSVGDITLGLANTSTTPPHPCGTRVSSRDWSAAAAPGRASPPPTSSTLPYSFFFMSAVAVEQHN